jgi:hypothetical protein
VLSAFGGGWGDWKIVSLLTLAVGIQLAQIATAVVCWRTVFSSRGRVSLPSFDALAVLFRRALPFAASGIVAQLTDALVADARYLDTVGLGLFGAASRFGSVADSPQASFGRAASAVARARTRSVGVSDRRLAAGVRCGRRRILVRRAVLRLVDRRSRRRHPHCCGSASVIGAEQLGRKVFLYASGGEALVVRWSAVALLVQVCLGALLIRTLGSVGAAVSVAAGEAVIWWPLRRATPRSATAINAEPALAGRVRLVAGPVAAINAELAE